MNISASRALSTATEPEPEVKGGIVSRFVVTAEVTVSKLFPAGFGWQAGYLIANFMIFIYFFATKNNLY